MGTRSWPRTSWRTCRPRATLEPTLPAAPVTRYAHDSFLSLRGICNISRAVRNEGNHRDCPYARCRVMIGASGGQPKRKGSQCPTPAVV